MGAFDMHCNLQSAIAMVGRVFATLIMRCNI